MSNRNPKIIQFKSRKERSVNIKADVMIIDGLTELLRARGTLRKSMKDLLIAEENAVDLFDLEFTIKLHKLRRKIIVLWQEIENDIENLA